MNNDHANLLLAALAARGVAAGRIRREDHEALLEGLGVTAAEVQAFAELYTEEVDAWWQKLQPALEAWVAAGQLPR